MCFVCGKYDCPCRLLVVSMLMAVHVTKFLKRPTYSSKVTAMGKRVNRGGGCGLELPCEYLIYGDKFSCEWLKKNLTKKGFDCK